MKHPKYGKAASGQRLERMKKSPQYKNGTFHNQHHTPPLTEGHSMAGVMFDFLFKRYPRRRPVDIIPSVKTDLRALPADGNLLVWFGHSSYFLQADGKKFLVDPVFSGNASPVAGSNRAFKGADIYKADDMPDIDVLIITHDHYDHLDYETVVKLRPRVRRVVTGLGVGAHLEAWGYAPENIIEKDWNESMDLGDGFMLYTTPARHFSGRTFKRNTTLWLSILLQTPMRKIFLGGDSGYDTHFAEIGRRFGPVDLAILENGQYDVQWRYIHLHPDEVLKAAWELGARRLFPVHSGKFAMSRHPWDEPLKRITELNKIAALPIMTPKIGQVVNLDDPTQQFENWWEGVK